MLPRQPQPDFGSPTAELIRYNPSLIIEDTELEQKKLETMLGILSIISKTKFLTEERKFCRVGASFVTKDGKKVLLFSASTRGHHGEVMLANAIRRHYHDDPTVVSGNVLNVDRMYVDIKPCDGKRYGKHNHCDRLLREGGWPVKIDGKKMNLCFKANKVFWNVPLPAEDVGSRARGDNLSEQDECVFGYRFKDIANYIEEWDECYVMDEFNGELIKIDLKEIFQEQLNENRLDEEGVKLKEELIKLTKEKKPEILSKITFTTLKNIIESNNEVLFHLFINHIQKKSSLRLLSKNISLNAEKIHAIRELQFLYSSKPQPVAKPASQKKPVRWVKLVKKENPVINQEKQEDISEGENSNGSEEMELAITESLNMKEEIEEGEIEKIEEIENAAEENILGELMGVDSEDEHQEIKEKDEHPETIQKMELEKPSETHQLDKNIKKFERRHFYTFNLARDPKLFSENLPYINNPDLPFRLSPVGWTPLNILMQGGHPQSLIVYLEALKELAIAGKLPRYSEALTQLDENGRNPLHHAMFLGDPEKLLIYLVELKSAFERGLLEKDKYIEALCAFNALKSSPLSIAFNRGRHVCAAIYLQFLRQAVLDKILPESDYINLLTMRNEFDNFIPLIQALDEANNDNVILFFQALHQAREENWIDDIEFFNTLVTHDTNKNNPVGTALKASNSENAALFFRELQKVFNNIKDKSPEIISKYVRALTEANEHGYTPFVQAIINKNPENFAIFFKILRQAFRDGYIDPNLYLDTLINNKASDGTYLCQLLGNGNSYEVELYLTELEWLFDHGFIEPKVFGDYLLEKGHHDYNAFHEVFKSNNPKNIKRFITLINKAIANGCLTNEDYFYALNAPNDVFTTPMFFVLINGKIEHGNIENVELYFEQLFAFKKDPKSDKKSILKEIKKFFLEVKENGSTILHHAALSNNPNVVIYLVGLIEREFEDKDRIDILSELLWAKTKAGFIPGAKLGAKKDDETRKAIRAVDEYLRKQREKYPKPKEIRDYSYKGNKRQRSPLSDQRYHDRDRYSKTIHSKHRYKEKRPHGSHRDERDKREHQRREEHTPRQDKKISPNTGKYNASTLFSTGVKLGVKPLIKTNILNRQKEPEVTQSKQNESFPAMSLPIPAWASKEKNTSSGHNFFAHRAEDKPESGITSEILEEKIYNVKTDSGEQYELHQKYSQIIEDHDHDMTYRLYGGNWQDKKFYIIELIKPLKTENFSFANFKPDKTGIFIFNSLCPADSILSLPTNKNLTCMILNQNHAVTVIGEPELKKFTKLEPVAKQEKATKMMRG